jgi:hypothetical protein
MRVTANLEISTYGTLVVAVMICLQEGGLTERELAFVCL